MVVRAVRPLVADGAVEGGGTGGANAASVAAAENEAATDAGGSGAVAEATATDAGGSGAVAGATAETGGMRGPPRSSWLGSGGCWSAEEEAEMDPSLSTGGTPSHRSAAPAQGEVQKSCQRIECSCRRFVSESNAGDAECGPRRGSCAWRRGDAYVQPARAFRPQAMRARRQRHTCCSRLIRSTAAHQPGGGPFERRSGGADDGAKDAHLLSRLGRRPPIRLRTLPGTRRAPRGARGHWVLDRGTWFSAGSRAGGG